MKDSQIFFVSDQGSETGTRNRSALPFGPPPILGFNSREIFDDWKTSHSNHADPILQQRERRGEESLIVCYFGNVEPLQWDNAAQFLHARGWIKTSLTYPGSLTRPESDIAILDEILQRLDS